MKVKYRNTIGWENPAKLYFGFFTAKQKDSIETALLDCEKIMYNKRKTNTEKFKNEPKNKYYIQLITDDYIKFETILELMENVEYKLDEGYETYII